jgi:DNA polymerase-3 subunit delta
MAVLTREDLRNQLRRRELAPVYVLFGAETYLRDLAAKTVADFAFSEGDFRDFNDATFTLNSPDNLQSALAAAAQLPMMATRRVVRVVDVRITAAGKLDTVKEEHEAVLSAYLSKPSGSSIVIFITDELNGVRKMSKLLKANSVAVEFGKLDDAELLKWAKDKFNESEAKADDRVVRELVDLVGADVRRLTTEVEKLVTASLPEKIITTELVDSLIANAREIPNFDLTDHLVAGRGKQALEVLKKILDDGAEPLALLGLISYNFRRLLMAKEMMEHGAERKEIANILKLRYNDQEPFLAAARRADAGKLISIIKRLPETDLAIKTSKGGSGVTGARMQLEMLVCELIAS